MTFEQRKSWERRFNTASLSVLIAALIWTPFPLGSAITWGGPVMAVLIGASWIFWSIGAIFSPSDLRSNFRRVAVPLFGALLVLIWCGIQLLPTSSHFANPIWQMVNETPGMAADPRTSMNVWHGETQLLMLSTDVAAAWLAYSIGYRVEHARVLLKTVSCLTAFYAMYAIILRLIGTSQAALVYRMPAPRSYISGPFMLHNSFATYCGLGAVASVLILIDEYRKSIIGDRGWKQYLLSELQFISGKGAISILAVLLTVGGLIASASRGGFFATVAGLLVVIVMLTFRAGRDHFPFRIVSSLLILLVPIIILLVSSGQSLAVRLGGLVGGDLEGNLRIVLWKSAVRMIEVFPWTGTGLGTFRDAYPLFATQVVPYVIDRAHSDYLEFAAGIGLPAAIAWWISMAWLACICVKGGLTRRRNFIFPIAGISAIGLVAVHSAVDFSLQIPAVALVFSVLLGIGVAQSRRSSSLRE